MIYFIDMNAKVSSKETPSRLTRENEIETLRQESLLIDSNR